MTRNRRARLLQVSAVALGAVMILAGCAGGETPTTDEPRTLLLGHGAAPGNPRTIAAEIFSERLAELTDGSLEVQVQGAEQLGSDSEMMVSITSGTLDMTANSQGTVSALVPEVSLFGLPFLFDSSEHAYEVLDGDTGDEIAALADNAGFKVLAWWDNGIRDITNNARPINTPDDLAGLKIRTPEDPMTVDIFNALDANPTPLAFGELYLALQQGAVDGQENPVTNVKSAKLQEVQSHLAITGHKYEVTPFIISLSTWNSLSSDQQDAVQTAADEARDEQRSLMVTQINEIYEEFESVIAITRPELGPFRTATASVYDKWESSFPELVGKLVDEANATR